VTHDVQETAAISDYGYEISEGKVIGQGTPEALGKTDSDRVKQFMQGLPDGPVPFHYPAPGYMEDLLDA
jgi:phospholipid/cholesterol/gamma-HCH transport system ATP-binding protein